MRVAVSWSGGLESSLACNKVIKEGHDVVLLVTFVLDKYWPAMGHPPEIMKIQSKAMGIPHILVKVDDPFKEGYRKAKLQSDILSAKGVLTPQCFCLQVNDPPSLTDLLTRVKYVKES